MERGVVDTIEVPTLSCVVVSTARRLLVSIAALSACVAIFECRSPTEITLHITSNACKHSTHQTEIIVGVPAKGIDVEPPRDVTTTCDPSTGEVGTFVVIPGASENPFEAVVIMGVDQLVSNCSPASMFHGCIVQRRILTFVDSTPIDVYVDLSLDCEGQGCDTTSTCQGGSCVRANVSVPCELNATCAPGADAQPPQDTGRPDSRADVAQIDARKDAPADAGSDRTVIQSDTGLNDGRGDAGSCAASATPSACLKCCEVASAPDYGSAVKIARSCFCSDAMFPTCGLVAECDICGDAGSGVLLNPTCVTCDLPQLGKCSADCMNETGGCHQFIKCAETCVAPASGG
jgi:hypothetical protein